MEEADVLSDRIAVIVDGKIKCVGTPLQLKNNYGDGYRVSIVSPLDQEEKVLSLITQIAPSTKLIDSSGGSMVFTIPFDKIEEISPLFTLMQDGVTKRHFEDNDKEGALQ